MSDKYILYLTPSKQIQFNLSDLEKYVSAFTNPYELMDLMFLQKTIALGLILSLDKTQEQLVPILLNTYRFLYAYIKKHFDIEPDTENLETLFMDWQEWRAA